MTKHTDSCDLLMLRDGGSSPQAQSTELNGGHQLAILAETFRLLGDPSRLRILLCCLHTPQSVGVMAQALDLSQTLVSHHLRLLRGARLVRRERQAKQVFYEVADVHVRTMLLDMLSHIDEEHDGE